MTDPPLFPAADERDDSTSEEPLGTLTVEDDLSPGTDRDAGTAVQADGHQADDYQADEAHDWTGGSPS